MNFTPSLLYALVNDEDIIEQILVVGLVHPKYLCKTVRSSLELSAEFLIFCLFYFWIQQVSTKHSSNLDAFPISTYANNLLLATPKCFQQTLPLSKHFFRTFFMQASFLWGLFTSWSRTWTSWWNIQKLWSPKQVWIPNFKNSCKVLTHWLTKYFKIEYDISDIWYINQPVKSIGLIFPLNTS